ncbi:MAG: sodium:solute symporter [Acidobacteria bacterium]|nr:sodium:solute symporter [Acidobacteriota bacterium]
MSVLDWFVIFLYLAAVIAVGIYVGRHQGDMKDYFLGGRNIPWWAAVLSMVATEVSAATFLGAPEQGYTRDFTYLQFAIGSILARFVLAFLFIGIYYKLDVYTVYGFLSKRFGYPTKNTAAGAFLLGRIFAGGSRLFIASLAVKVITGFDMSVSIIILGSIAIVYTVFGGIKAVIWTDVVQAIVLVGGAILAVAFLLGDIPLSNGEIMQMLSDNHKFRLFDTDNGDGTAWISNAYHFFPALLGGFFLTMATHGTDQAMIQRLLTCKDSARSKFSMVFSGFFGIFVAGVFMVIGMLLFVYVQTRQPGDHMLQVAQDLASTGQNGHYFLHYILEGLPRGISGLIIASVVAAAMSSCDSELNSMSATFINDFYIPYFKSDASNQQLMKIARYATIVSGIFLIGLAILIADFYANNPQTDLLSIALGVMTLFYGSLLGVFLLGLLTRTRGSNLTNVIGMVSSLVVIVLISYRGWIPFLGLYDPSLGGTGFWADFYQFKLGWPWFIVIGTAVSIGIGALGVTTKEMINRYRNDLAESSQA